MTVSNGIAEDSWIWTVEGVEPLAEGTPGSDPALPWIVGVLAVALVMNGVFILLLFWRRHRDGKEEKQL